MLIVDDEARTPQNGKCFFSGQHDGGVDCSEMNLFLFKNALLIFFFKIGNLAFLPSYMCEFNKSENEPRR